VETLEEHLIDRGSGLLSMMIRIGDPKDEFHDIELSEVIEREGLKPRTHDLL
jgi:hypothetical protein